MNALALDRCFHCGEALPNHPLRLSLRGRKEAVCCAGCAAAANWITEAGLADYYTLRQTAGARVDAEPADYSAWDRADVQAGHAIESDGQREITIVVEGMRCAACAWLIDRALSQSPGLIEAGANAVTGRVRLRWDPERTLLSSLLARLAGLGYRPHLAQGEARERERRRERNQLIARIGVAALGAMQAMMFSEALYLDSAHQMGPATRDFFRWLSFLVSTPVVFYAGWPFLAGMLRECRLRRFGMDTLVASSVLLAYFASLAQTLRGGPQVWFDAAVMFVFLLLVARALERLARLQANAQLDALARAQPALARRIVDGHREQVAVSALRAGDQVALAANEAVPADGVLLGTDADFDEALLTGEATPVRKSPGAPVFAGSLCRDRAATIEVRQTGGDTRLSQLVRLVERAQAHRPPLARRADAIASRFVLALFATAAVTAWIWWRVDPSRSFEIALAVLVVSCPCALSLAIPAALASAHAHLAKRGVLVLSPDALETLARANTVLFDKTGTLTRGRSGLQSIAAFGGLSEARAHMLAAALEQDSGHPLADAFRWAGPLPLASEVRAVAGRGVQGRIENRDYRLGRASFAFGGEDDEAIWLGDGAHALARFEVLDPTRAEAKRVIADMKRLGLRPAILSGDAPERVAAVCAALDIEEGRGRMTPEDKLATMRERQSRGEIVLMVGDGLNDAPVLAGADVSVAVGGSAPLAQRAADLVLTGDSLRRLPEAVELARRSGRIVRQNLSWALGYNLLALPFAAFGWITPGYAALGMASSSLIVTLNALRLGREPRSQP